MVLFFMKGEEREINARQALVERKEVTFENDVGRRENLSVEYRDLVSKIRGEFDMNTTPYDNVAKRLIPFIY